MALRADKRYALFLFLAVIFTLSTIMPQKADATSARFSGAYLREMCSIDKNGRERVKGGFVACHAYISGVIDYQNVLQSLKLAPRVDVCIPDGVTMWDLQKTVLIFLSKTNTHDSFVAAPAVAMALHQKYPCK